MAEAKLQDPSNDSELDAVAKAVKEKNLFTARSGTVNQATSLQKKTEAGQSYGLCL